MNTHAPDIDRLLIDHAPTDPVVVETLVQGYYPAILRLAQTILHDLSEADDAAQDTFITAAVKLDKYEIGTNFRAWLYTIGVNTCRGYLRKRKIRLTLQNTLRSFQSLVNGSPDPEETALQTETGAELWDAVDKLGEKHRLVVLFRIVHELSIREITQILGIPEKTVYTRLYDAMHKLRKQLTREVEQLPSHPRKEQGNRP